LHQNLEMAANFPESKDFFGKLDWNKGVPESLRDQFNFVLGCDCALSSSSVGNLAELVAYTLKKDNGTFLHVGPQEHETLYDLQLLLRMEYGINAKMKEIIVERIDLSPHAVMMDSLEDVEAQMRSEDEGSYVEYIDMHTSRYSTLIVDHDHKEAEQEAVRIEEEAVAEANEILRVEAEQEAARIEEEAVAEAKEILRVKAEQEAARIEEEAEAEANKILNRGMAEQQEAARIESRG